MEWLYLTLVLALSVTAGDAMGTINCTLTPNEDFLVSYDSDENITFHCELGSQDLSLQWVIIPSDPSERQIQLQSEMIKQEYERNYGLFVEDIQTNESRLIVTQQARSELSESSSLGNEKTLEINCFPIITSVSCHDSSSRTVTTFGPLEPPSNLKFVGLPANEFQLSWTPPNLPSSKIDIEYIVQVTNLSSDATDTNFFNTSEDRIVITFNENGTCSEFNFTVLASNEEVGNSSVISIMENIPISPDVSNITSDTITAQVDVTDPISINITFPQATACSEDNYPIQNYILSLENGTEITLFPTVDACANDDDDSICATINERDIPGLSVDQVINYNMSACSNVTCRSTGTFTAYTTAIQQPSVYFVQEGTNFLLSCGFANGSKMGIRCLFSFEFNTTTNDGQVNTKKLQFNFTKDSRENSMLCDDGPQACMCITTHLPVDNYFSIEAYTLEEDGMTRSSISVPVVRRNVTEAPEMIVACNPPTSGLDTEEAVGIAIAVIFVIIIITAIVIIGVFVGGKKAPHTNTAVLEKESKKVESDCETRVPQGDGDSEEENKQQTTKQTTRAEVIIKQICENGDVVLIVKLYCGDTRDPFKEGEYTIKAKLIPNSKL